MTNVARPARTLTYSDAQRLAVAVGTLVLGVLALVMYARRVETVEVLAVLLFFPVFLAALRWNITGGLIAAGGSSVVYVAARWSAIHAVGFGTFSGLVTSRVLGFLVFGLVAGWANSQL